MNHLNYSSYKYSHSLTSLFPSCLKLIRQKEIYDSLAPKEFAVWKVTVLPWTVKKNADSRDPYQTCGGGKNPFSCQ